MLLRLSQICCVDIGGENTKIINFYCGLFLVKYKGTYACVDKYTGKIRCEGTYKSCVEYFDAYISKCSEENIYV